MAKAHLSADVPVAQATGAARGTEPTGRLSAPHYADSRAQAEPVAACPDRHRSFVLTGRPHSASAHIHFDHREWPGMRAVLVRFSKPVTFDFRFDGMNNCVMLFDLHRSAGATMIDGQSQPLVKELRDRLAFVPRGCKFWGWSEISRPGGFLMVEFERDMKGTELGGLPPRLGFDDQALRMVMRRLWAIFDDPSLDQPRYAETLGELIAFETHRAVAHTDAQQPSHGGLTTRQVRVVDEYMQAHVADKVAIADLAHLVGLTRFHFIRSFKQSVGYPPHQYLTHRRVDLAKDLLAQQSTSIAQVAARTGFQGTAQFARAFRRVVGVSPSCYRRNLR